MIAAAILLFLALGAASMVALAQTTNDPMTRLRACSAMEQSERLACLERLSRSIPSPQRTPAEASGWIVSETTSPVDYSPIMSAATTSRASADGSFMQLTIHCRNGRTELALSGPSIARGGEDYLISYRVHDDPPIQAPAATPSFGAGAAFRGDVVRLLQTLPAEGDLTIRISSTRGAAQEGVFSLNGLKIVRDKAATACKWPHAIAEPLR